MSKLEELNNEVLVDYHEVRMLLPKAIDLFQNIDVIKFILDGMVSMMVCENKKCCFEFKANIRLVNKLHNQLHPQQEEDHQEIINQLCKAAQISYLKQ